MRHPLRFVIIPATVGALLLERMWQRQLQQGGDVVGHGPK